MIRFAGLFLLGLLLSGACAAASVDQEEHQARVLAIAKQLRCAVCQNQSVAESQSDLAEDMRSVISEKLRDGDEENAIIGYFVERYGDYVLMKPPNRGFARILWWAPLVLLLLISLVAWRYIRGTGDGPKQGTPVLTERQRQRLARLREQKRG